MFCGFGSIILLVMIVNSHAIRHREEVNSDLMAETDRLEQELSIKKTYLAELKNASEKIDKEVVETRGLSERVIKAVSTQREELGHLDQDTIARLEHIKKLQADLKSIDHENKAQKAVQQEKREEQGKKVRAFKGEGDRQYLTGIKMGGKRILILVDRSASMLGSTIVNIIRRRNLADVEKRRASKWRRAVATVEWLGSQLPKSSRFQIMIFNETSQPLLAGSSGWLESGNGRSLNRAMTALKKIIPEKGTNLQRVFAAAKKMQPKPDNIFLITDGLPTQAASSSSKRKVSGEQRLEYFLKAIETLPTGVPVNTILFPIEGDPMAAPVFWQLAVKTKGSYIAPAKDWP